MAADQDWIQAQAGTGSEMRPQAFFNVGGFSILETEINRLVY